MKPSNEILIAYLYGELEEPTRKQVELYLAQNPMEAANLQEMRELRENLQKIPFKMPQKPLVLSRNTNHTSHKALFSPFVRNFMAMAAAIALLLVAAYITQFRLNGNAEGWQLSFGDVREKNNPTTPANSIDTLQLVRWLENKQRKAYTDIYHKISALDNKVNESQKYGHNSESNNKEFFTKTEVLALLQKLRKEDYEVFKEVLASSSQEQQLYLSKAFEGFASYWEQKRQEDLEQIEASLSTFREQASEKFKENDVILTKLIDNQK